MLLTCYHGTTLESAAKITETGKFNLSSGDKEWLGTGIYFFFDIDDALNWRNAEAVIHAIIEVDSGAYLDLASERGKKLCKNVMDYLTSIESKIVTSKDEEANQCSVANLIWASCPEILALTCAFPTQQKSIPTIMEYRHMRREICLRDNSPIRVLNLIRRGDICGK